jgi:hypothetical protein
LVNVIHFHRLFVVVAIMRIVVLPVPVVFVGNNGDTSWQRWAREMPHTGKSHNANPVGCIH